ncbi:hypothetical protein [Rubripirellula reticaptiva]|uniref:Uncharacterized protein n=1 Tax=Rubripirellula reticaptiva TaxID=2528013 RepID=A0A5C6F779_9BACT|nr:hypothetical protein [Rubripirellula reticaptiva]TWU56297.1 hypothetical protein Poly59_26010 [Rubripirellula reticaptiva]
MKYQSAFGWTRFGIATLLFLTLCAAGSLVGFRYGMSKGVDAQVDQRIAALRLQVYPVIYRVTDLTGGAAQPIVGDALSAKALAREIQDAVGQIHWGENGGPCTLRALDPESIVVSASTMEHELVVAYLEGRRKTKSGAPAAGPDRFEVSLSGN